MSLVQPYTYVFYFIFFFKNLLEPKPKQNLPRQARYSKYLSLEQKFGIEFPHILITCGPWGTGRSLSLLLTYLVQLIRFSCACFILVRVLFTNLQYHLEQCSCEIMPDIGGSYVFLFSLPLFHFILYLVESIKFLWWNVVFRLYPYWVSHWA